MKHADISNAMAMKDRSRSSCLWTNESNGRASFYAMIAETLTARRQIARQDNGCVKMDLRVAPAGLSGDCGEMYKATYATHCCTIYP